jgi:pre-mRNA branch site protein p14
VVLGRKGDSDLLLTFRQALAIAIYKFSQLKQQYNRHSLSIRSGNITQKQLRMASASVGPHVTRVLVAKNLPYRASAEEVANLFDRYGTVRQVRLGVEPETKGTAYIVFDDLFAAQRAQESLNNYHMHDRYIIVRFHKVGQ